MPPLRPNPSFNPQVIAEAVAGFNADGSDPLLDHWVEEFNFAGPAGAFDVARVANPMLTNWALSNAPEQLPSDRVGQRRTRR